MQVNQLNTGDFRRTKHAMFHVKPTLLADTEGAENNIQKIVGRGGPGNLPKKVNGQAKL